MNKDEIRRWVAYFLLIFPHAKPGYFAEVPLLDNLYDGLRVGSFIIIIFFGLMRKKISFAALFISLMELYLVINTIVHGGEVHRSIVIAASVISIVLLYDLVLSEPKYKKTFYSSLLAVFEILIYINLITEIMWPQGLYTTNSGYFKMQKCHFLGYYNNHTQFFIPGLLAAWLFADLAGKHLRARFLMIAIWASALITWSGGVLASLGVITLVYILTKNRRLPLFNYYVYWLIHPIFVTVVILYNSNKILLSIIDYVFHKARSFGLRISLWSNCVMLISKKLIFGYGIWDQKYREDQVGFFWGMHAHNMILEVLYQGGLVYFILFVIIVMMCGKQLRIVTRESNIISIAFLGWIVATLVEPFTSPFLMGMFIIAANSNSQFRCSEEKHSYNFPTYYSQLDKVADGGLIN